MTHVIAQPCIGEKSQDCVEVCPVDCIHDGGEQFYIDPKECIDCGACVSVCPVTAIFAETDLPAEWTSFTQTNAQMAAKGPVASQEPAEGAQPTASKPADNSGTTSPPAVPVSAPKPEPSAQTAPPPAEEGEPSEDGGPVEVLEAARKPPAPTAAKHVANAPGKARERTPEQLAQAAGATGAPPSFSSEFNRAKANPMHPPKVANPAEKVKQTERVAAATDSWDPTASLPKAPAPKVEKPAAATAGTAASKPVPANPPMQTSPATAPNPEGTNEDPTRQALEAAAQALEAAAAAVKAAAKARQTRKPYSEAHSHND